MIFLFKIRNLNELNYTLKENEFVYLLLKKTSIDTIRDTLKVIDLK
jgi:hypothetical protein